MILIGATELTVEDFEPSFLQLMEAFENLKPEDRLIHLQAAIFGTGVTGEYLTEMIDLFSAALQVLNLSPVVMLVLKHVV